MAAWRFQLIIIYLFIYFLFVIKGYIGFKHILGESNQKAELGV